MIPREHECRGFQPQLRDRPRPCRQFLAGPERDTSGDVAAAVMDMNPEAIPERSDRPRGNFQLHVEDLARAPEPGERHDVATMHPVNRIDIRQIQRRSSAGPARVDVAAVRLDPANACRFSRRLNDHQLAAPQDAAKERPGHHGAGARQREDPIHRQPRLADVAGRRGVGQHTREGHLQVSEPSPGDHRSGNDGSVGKWAVLQPLTDCRDRTRFIRREIGLGQRHHGLAHAEVGEDLQMLFRLRHPPIVSRDNQQGEVDRSDARDHVLDEVFVARHVDDPETKGGR